MAHLNPIKWKVFLDEKFGRKKSEGIEDLLFRLLYVRSISLPVKMEGLDLSSIFKFI